MTAIKNLRFVAIAEGISFLILLFIAMPIKYMLGVPEVVRYVGWAHGVLFIAYIIALIPAIRPMKWNLIGLAVAFIASLLPFGTFILDRQLKRKLLQLQTQTS